MVPVEGQKLVWRALIVFFKNDVTVRPLESKVVWLVLFCEASSGNGGTTAADLTAIRQRSARSRCQHSALRAIRARKCFDGTVDVVTSNDVLRRQGTLWWSRYSTTNSVSSSSATAPSARVRCSSFSPTDDSLRWDGGRHFRSSVSLFDATTFTGTPSFLSLAQAPKLVLKDPTFLSSDGHF